MRLRRARHRLKLTAHAWMRPRAEYQPLFVLATGRCGSTLLVDLLRGIPGVDCSGELLHPELPKGIGPRERSAAKALRHIRRSLHAMRAPIRGGKLMLYQMQSCRLTAEDLRQAFPDAKYLILYRESLAEQFVSDRCARATQQWVLRRDQQRSQARIEIDPAELQRFCEATRWHYEQLLAHDWLRERSLLLSYEELVAARRAWMVERICPFMGVPPCEPATRMVKQSVQPLQERVVNHAEVTALIAGAECRQRHCWPARHAA